jgi:ABC-2 type transport system ATP-binding protein
VVREVGLTMAAGEVIGFVGPNGAGKTTTLRMLAGLMRPDVGEGTILGHDIAEGGRKIAAQVGYMSQRLALYDDLTVVDNLRFRADLYELKTPKVRVSEVLADFGLEAFRNQRAGRLSGGWARRLQLAATLIHDPKLVLLDEPTAGLDSLTKRDVWHRIVALAARGMGVVINTHDLAEAEQCTRVALFSSGQVTAVGTPAEVSATTGLLALLVNAKDIPSLRATLANQDGIVIDEMRGGRLRLLIEVRAADRLKAAVAGQGGDWEQDDMTLADVAFWQPEPVEGAAP